jgi:hypothetical protein
MNRITASVLAAALAGLLLAGCAGEQPQQKEVSIADITAAVEAVLDFDPGGMHSADREYMLMLLEIDGEAIGDFVMKTPTGTNQNEYGLFIAAPEREKDVENAVNAYLQTRKEEWDEQYLPEEGFKIDAGRCGRDGRYVYYVIGGDNFDKIAAVVKENTAP